MEWIMSANPLVYDHQAAFEANGFIDWKQTRHFSVGDIIYIYCSKTIAKVQYKVCVEKIDLDISETIEDSLYWKQKIHNANKTYMRLKLIKYVDNDALSLVELRKHGMEYAPQSPNRLNTELSEYLKHFFEGNRNE